MTGDDLAAADREWRREVESRKAVARAAAPDDPSILEKFGDALCAVSSEQRLPLLLHLVERRPPTVFWPVFLSWWDCCDDTWIWRDRALRALRRQHAQEPGPDYLRDDDRAFFDGLPDQVEVFRGCSRRRARGLSWTTDRTIAERFAHGHRGIRVPDPVIARAAIQKARIFAASTERKESEVVIDPRGLRLKLECAQ